MSRYRTARGGRYSGHNIEQLLHDLAPAPEPEPAGQRRPVQRTSPAADAERNRLYNSPVSPDIPPDHLRVAYPGD
jgi:hypothetical protein